MKRTIAFAAALVFSCAAFAQQQSYPSRPIRMIVPWPPGQATDLAGRVVALKLSELLGQQVIADNRPGAGGMIGTDMVAKAAADGYTLLAASSGPVTINPLLQKVPFDPVRDLVPVANVGLSPYLLVTHPKFPAANIKEFVATIKASPGKYRFASSGTGATAHLVAEMFNAATGLQAVHVPYKGSAPALTDIIAGDVTYATETVAATMPHVRTGRLKAYGISTAKPSALAPGIEPFATSLNLPGFDAAAWIGVMVPTGTPRPVVDRLSKAVDTAMQAPDTRERLNAAGLEVDYRPTSEFGGYLKDQRARFAEIIRKNNIRLD
jgi:tripartite-type tricarboxylate transporter receptor subunit TctC